ncbi:hypothetical protein D3C78_1507860 [compost metagenome]
MNMDRTARNTNMLMWHKELWLIDHGASLYFHHSGLNWEEQALRPFSLIKDHVLLNQATMLEQVDQEFKVLLTEERIRSIIALLPEDWLTERSFESAEEQREMYARFLTIRIANSSIFVNEANHARETVI